MKFTIITLFPNLIQTNINESIVKRAVEKKLIDVEILNLRDFSTLNNQQIDDYQYGGGAGMVIMVEPVVKAIESCKTKDSLVLLTSPQGITLNQCIAKEYSKNFKHIIIICGHYEGFDERVLDYVDFEISIGDYILTGGELPALILVDSITRLINGVIKEDSHINDSFENNLLDHPVYTKPLDFRGKKVPDVLISGHHAKVKDYRNKQRLKNTYNKRPDLINYDTLSIDDIKYLKELKDSKGEN
ncbi:tRNA (guanosine(37)-N1)-methyltransferase TrmD [Spiroplasma turonicum]|uniref:tRNA (guanine-N(1)-)-methyltransferase n=1 Tax=Spiroplasma turonicum TaxID=216946 RepID=A0A0K1P6Y4_9MOLU|nr:tRNA (guanosine(37)-N1)-methyltransferase TrmD [Spiroplasma turonicum]AKU80058.1 tRNA (guanine-N(1)-)-methyltransferase [Spiroplasma turonicum]ALX71060.1 tRNA (guanine-N(1)-)-methyltransferase [Spiroplasma turonicum]